MIIEPIFKWNSEDGRLTASYRTWGTFGIYVDGELFWGSDEFNWTWYEMLDWLILNWSHMHEATELPKGNEDEEYAWWFAYRHDFKHSLPGVRLPLLLVWRDNLGGYMRTGSRTLAVPVEQWEQFLRDTAAAIAEQLKDCVDDPMSEHLVEGYQREIAQQVN